MTSSFQAIMYDSPANEFDLQMLREHGWEISADKRQARLYSEGWSSIQAAIASTKWWIEDCK